MENVLLSCLQHHVGEVHPLYKSLKAAANLMEVQCNAGVRRRRKEGVLYPSPPLPRQGRTEGAQEARPRAKGNGALVEGRRRCFGVSQGLDSPLRGKYA